MLRSNGVLPVSTYPWVPVGKGPALVLHSVEPPQALALSAKPMMLAARAGGTAKTMAAIAARAPRSRGPEANLKGLVTRLLFR